MRKFLHAVVSKIVPATSVAPGAQLEDLERRALLSGATVALDPAGVLTVLGTRKADTIVFSLDAQDATKLNVTVNGSTSVFNVSSVIGIKIDADGGDDTVLFDETVGAIDINATVLGGKGKDTIIGGSGDDRLYGNGGSDDLDGGAGNDWVVGGDGTDRLAGGTGFNLLGAVGRDEVVFASGSDVIVPDLADMTELA